MAYTKAYVHIVRLEIHTKPVLSEVEWIKSKIIISPNLNRL